MRRCLSIGLCLLAAMPATGHADEEADRFKCGGELEKEVWRMWDGGLRERLDADLLQRRLLGQGDVFALYDLQANMQNMVMMARRCGRTDRIREAARMIGAAYGTLQKSGQDGRRWLCTGGSYCNEKNRLLNREVMLNSVQFLGLSSTVANALARADEKKDDADREFIAETVGVVTEHMLRWGGDKAVHKIKMLAETGTDEVDDTSSSLFFTDGPLWLITVYAELSGILAAGGASSFVKLQAEDKASMHGHLAALLRFFDARISFRAGPPARVGKKKMADLDRGYWRLYAENRYAGYEGDISPVVCTGDKAEGARAMQMRIPPEEVSQRNDTGWDFSHARRLVYALDALSRNRRAIEAQMGVPDKLLPGADLARAFANNLVGAVWNGDKRYPLFSNYWSGANGWYRVGYRGVTGKCREGVPPFGLSSSFLTGGYITWAGYEPLIGKLGERLYELLNSEEKADVDFIRRYYREMGGSSRPAQAELMRFMFYPTLVAPRRG